MNHRTKYLLWMILGLIAGCTRYNPNIRFDKKGWNQKKDWDYPHRENMVDDLIKHHQLKGLSYKQLIDSLGEPENFPDTSGLHYQLLMDFGDNIDPVHTKYLVFKLNKDSVVTGFRIKEWESGN